MGFSNLSSSRTTHTGSLQSLVSTGVNLTASTDTGTIDAATNWSSSISDGHAFAIVRAGAVIAVRCAKSVSTTRLTYFRLYLDDGAELATDVQVGDTITIYEQPEVVAAGSALSAVTGITLTTYGSAQVIFRDYNIGANAITTTGFLQIPSKHLLIFGPTAPPGLTLQSGANGRLAIGWYRTQGGVSAFCADLIIRGTYTAASNFNPVDSLLCTNSTSARVDWFGGVEESKAPSPANNDSLGTMIIYSKSCRAKGLDTVGNYQCRIQSSNFRSYGLTIENRSFALLALATLNGFKPINCDQAIAMAAGSPAGYTPVTGADLRGGNILDIGYRADKKVRLINHKRGSAIIPGGNTSTADIQNRGVHEIRQETTVSLRNLAGSNVDGARVFMRDTNNGNRIAASTFTGSDDYTADRTYEGVTSSGSVSFTTNGGVLLADVYQNVANVAVTRFQDIVWDYRSRNNNSTDVFRFGYAAYGYLPATVDAALQGDVPYVVSAVPIADSAITEATQATVAAYTALETLAKVYDYSCHWLTLSGSNMETAGLGMQLLSYSGGVLDCGALNVVIDATAASVFTVAAGTMTIKASSLSGTKIQTTGTITLANGATINTSTYQSSAGLFVSLSVASLVAGSRVQLYNVTDAVEIYNGVVAGTSYSQYLAYTADKTIRLRATKTSGVTAKAPFETTGTLTVNGLALTAAQGECPVYDAYGIDGSTVTGFTADYTDDEVDLTVAANFYLTHLFAWWCYNLTTEQGIADFFGGITPVDEGNIQVNDDIVDIYLDNTTSSDVWALDNRRFFRADGARPVKNPTTGGGGIDVEWREKVLFVNEADIAAIKAKTDNLPSDPADNSEILAAINAIAIAGTASLYAPTAATRTVGDDEGGTVADLAAHDDSYFITGEVVGTGLDVTVTRATSPIDQVPSLCRVSGRYQGSPSHFIQVSVWNFSTSSWDAKGTMGNRSTDGEYTFPLSVDDCDPTTGEMRIRFLHNVATYIAAHALRLDFVSFEKVSTNSQLGSDVAAIKAKTDALAFTVPGQVDANIQYVNDVAVTGNGQAGTEWGPG